MWENWQFQVKTVQTLNAIFEKDVKQAIQEVEEKQQDNQENEQI